MASALEKLEAGYSETAFGDDDKTLLLEEQESSSTIEVVPSDNEVEVLPESSPVHIPKSPSAAISALVRRGTRFTITPVLVELMSTWNRRVIHVLSRTAPYGRAFQQKITSLSTRSSSVTHEREALVDHEEIQNCSRHIGSDEPTTLEFPSPQNSTENPPEQHRSFMQRYTACSRYAANSYYIVYFLLKLLALSCFTFYVGIAYFNECEFLEHLPSVFVLMGASGMVGTFCRIVYILMKKRWSTRFDICLVVTFGAMAAFLLSYTFGKFSSVLTMVWTVFPHD